MRDSHWVNRNGRALADCPCRELAVGKYKGMMLETTPIEFQKWTQKLGYPERLFTTKK